MNESYIKFKRLTRWWGLAIAMFCSLLLTVACHYGGSIPVNEQITNAACRDLKHSAGITCIPDKFERLVTLDDTSLENAIALGIQPVGSVISEFSSHWREQMTGVNNIGTMGEPNLESILGMKPDFIIGFKYFESIYSLLSKIGPTVLFKFENSGQWKQVFNNIGVALGKEETAKEVTENYYRRLAKFQENMDEYLAKIQVSVVRVYPDKINLYLRDSFCGTVLQDAGLSRPKSQSFTASEAKKLFGNPIQVSISKELIEKADGDVIFIWTYENNAKGNQTAKKKLEELQANPLWKNLKAVRNNKVYVVPSYWIGSGMLAANAIIDDLFQYLVNTP
ncbi:iron-siderophore ABC transporter substrate-binding protein [Anabaenopsis tanganyikae CS-531]|uniref:Iron-siderophore ABC transporter substrate-binding protein n=2 Tax=Anabaenopsis TaxID=110103 RepID=A0ABT6KFW3_9CYAN|nr:MULTISPECIES: iron-siderophore ABC transporter substrate-binding protein [Anabaenopsis]MDB9538597.1 iron-siderophore ABC transporter substrate-binding protein [Anabaenopsis arnoldii]MDH6090870.1 iron-siderophore ABC transporter substrate-binding protein [Anabaenopsis arnoldii]MDH6106643.1 iron-siderophore ABC transporter substrate-binding protein [Anabaenopsis tanganyikae CS-531]